MQPSHHDLAVAQDDNNRSATARRVLLSVFGAALLVLGLSLLDAAPVIALLLGVLGLLVIGLGQVKRQPKRSLRHSLRAAAMVSARMDSIADNPPPSSRKPD